MPRTQPFAQPRANSAALDSRRSGVFLSLGDVLRPDRALARLAALAGKKAVAFDFRGDSHPALFNCFGSLNLGFAPDADGFALSNLRGQRQGEFECRAAVDRLSQKKVNSM